MLFLYKYNRYACTHTNTHTCTRTRTHTQQGATTGYINTTTALQLPNDIHDWKVTQSLPFEHSW